MNDFFFIDFVNYKLFVFGSFKFCLMVIIVWDVVNIVVKVIEYEGEWLKIGGIVGEIFMFVEELVIGEKIRGLLIF